MKNGLRKVLAMALISVILIPMVMFGRETTSAAANEATGQLFDAGTYTIAMLQQQFPERNEDGIADYARILPVFEEYKAQRYSRKYLVEHEADIAVYRAAQASMRELLDGEKLPKMDVLKAEWKDLTSVKKSGYTKYREAQKEMREVVAVRANIDHLLGLTEQSKNKEMEH